jgi:hypothetical protein
MDILFRAIDENESQEVTEEERMHSFKLAIIEYVSKNNDIMERLLFNNSTVYKTRQNAFAEIAEAMPLLNLQKQKPVVIQTYWKDMMILYKNLTMVTVDESILETELKNAMDALITKANGKDKLELIWRYLSTASKDLLFNFLYDNPAAFQRLVDVSQTRGNIYVTKNEVYEDMAKISDQDVIQVKTLSSFWRKHYLQYKRNIKSDCTDMIKELFKLHLNGFVVQQNNPSRKSNQKKGKYEEEEEEEEEEGEEEQEEEQSTVAKSNDKEYDFKMRKLEISRELKREKMLHKTIRALSKNKNIDHNLLFDELKKSIFFNSSL